MKGSKLVYNNLDRFFSKFWSNFVPEAYEDYYNFSIFETQKIKFYEKTVFMVFCISSNIFKNFGVIFESKKSKDKKRGHVWKFKSFRKNQDILFYCDWEITWW
jgi:hypothetical protein